MTYVHPTRPDGAVKMVLPPTVAADPHEPPERNPKPWVVRVPVDFLDHRYNGGLGHRFGWMLLVLEAYCRTRCFCWAGNAELAKAYGVSANVLQAILKDMEDAGILHRVPTSHGRPGRLGIVLFRRADPDLPVAERDGLPDVIAQMNGTPSRAPKTGPSDPRKQGASRALKTGPPIKTSILKEDPFEGQTLTFANAPGPGEDPDPEVDRPVPAPAIAAPGGPQEPSRPSEALTLNPARVEGPTASSGVPAIPREEASDPPPTREQVESELAELEARIAARAPRPPSAMDRIRLKNLRDLRDGTWKADPQALETPPPTPRLVSWPGSVGPPAAPSPVEMDALIRRLVSPGSGPEAIEAAAARVADRLGDGHSLGYYRKAFARVQSGEVPLGVALSAWKRARSGTARCPGSVFVAALKGGGR